jgi:hypothetical protein
VTATITRPTPAGAVSVDEHALFVAAVRALYAAGWQQTWCPQEIATPGPHWDRTRISWDDAVWPDGRRKVWLTRSRPRPAGEVVDEVHVSSIQQAIDVLSGLLGVGVHLTTGARRWSQ